MKKTGLLIIDMQVAMFSFLDNQPFQGEIVVSNIQKLIKAAREKDIPVIFIQHNEEEGEFLRASKTWQILPALAPITGEPIIEKTASDAFFRTDLEQKLKELGISRLIITGMQSEFCVDATTRSAKTHGYETILVSDAHSTMDNNGQTSKSIVTRQNKSLGQEIAELMSTEEVLKLLIG